MNLLNALGKGPGFFLVAIAELAAGTLLAYKGADLTGFSLILGAVNAGLFGGGAWKAAAEAKAGNGLPPRA